MELTKPPKAIREEPRPLVWYHTIQRQRLHPKPYHCTRPNWGPRFAWAAILISGGYLAARIVPALLFH